MSRARRGLGRGAVAALLALVVSAPAVEAGGSGSAAVRYVGHFRLDQGVGKALLRVHFGRSGRPVTAFFQAKHVKLYCDDRSTRRVTTQPVHAAIGKDGAFEHSDYASTPEAQSFDRFTGRVESRKRASGRVVIGIDAPPGQPDCGTRAAGKWRAHQTRK